MVSLEEMKLYLNIDEEDLYYDDLISSLIEIADIYIDTCVGNAYKQDEKSIKLANILIKKLVLDMFENRSTGIANNIKQDRIVTSILDILANCGGDLSV